MKSTNPILILGGNELASAIALKLYNARLEPAIYVPADEIFLRHNLCFGDAVFQNRKTIEGVTAETLPEELMIEEGGNSYLEKAKNAIQYLIRDRKIPVLTHNSDVDARSLLDPPVIVSTLTDGDKTTRTMGGVEPGQPLIIGCYPHYVPGKNCDWAVDTRLNYRLGQVYHQPVDESKVTEVDIRLFKNPFEHCTIPLEGVWVALKEIGEPVKYNEALGKIDEVEIRSPYDGQIWGIAHSGRIYPPKAAIAQIYTGPKTEDYRYYGFRENAIAGGVLEAVLSMPDVK